MPLPLILDTDIGGDVDDLLALAVLLGSPEVDLRAVTTVYSDARLRARIAMKALALRSRSDIPVAPGADRTLNKEQPVFSGQYDGENILTPRDAYLHPIAEPADKLMAEMVMARPGQVHIAAIGPLTNLALALQRERRMAENVAGITVMGGVVGGYDRLDLDWVDYNFQCDPEAARVVLASGAPIRLIPLDVTMQVRIFPSDLTAIRQVGDPYHHTIADEVERYPYFPLQGFTYLHDPLAVATLIRPDLVEWTPIHAQVETGGEYSAGKLIASAPGENKDANAEIALRVDVSAAHQFIIERLLS